MQSSVPAIINQPSTEAGMLSAEYCISSFDFVQIIFHIHLNPPDRWTNGQVDPVEVSKPRQSSWQAEISGQNQFTGFRLN